MPEAVVQLPADSTGAKQRTRSYTVGANTVHEVVNIAQSIRVATGVYAGNAGVVTILVTAHATATAGFFWLLNPVGSSVSIALQTAEFMCTTTGAAQAHAQSPRVQLERMTFTGTHSGAQITAAKRGPSDATAAAVLSLNTTGITPTAGTVLFAFLPMAAATGTTKTYFNNAVADWTPSEDGQVVLAAGEGIVCRQPDNGRTTLDQRSFVMNLTWMEFTEP